MCYLLVGKVTVDREFGVLNEIPDNCSKYVVSMDEKNMRLDGFQNVNIRGFLLSNSI